MAPFLDDYLSRAELARQLNRIKRTLELRALWRFVRRYVPSDASVHDSQNIEDVLATSNTAKLAERGLMSRIQRPAYRDHELSETQKAANTTRLKVRARFASHVLKGIGPPTEESFFLYLHFFFSTTWRVNFARHEVAEWCMSGLEGLAILTAAECARVIRKNLRTSQLWRAQGQDPPYARIGKTPAIAAPPWHLKQERLPSAEGRSK